MTGKSEREQRHFDQFRAVFSGIPAAPTRPSHPSAPDFVLQCDPVLGVEVSEFLREAGAGGSALAAIEAARRDALYAAARTFEGQRGSDRVLVRVGFSEVTLRTKSRIRAVGRALGDLVARSGLSEDDPITIENEDEDDEILPAEVSYFTAVRMKSLAPSDWGWTPAYWGMSLTAEQVQERMNEKDLRIPRYRQHASVLWLLLAVDGRAESSDFEVPAAVLDRRYISCFDRAFLLDSFVGTVQELTLERT